jgi:hypothetical protein
MRLAAYQFAVCGDIAGSDRINVNVVSEAIQELQKLADELDIHIIVKQGKTI